MPRSVNFEGVTDRGVRIPGDPVTPVLQLEGVAKKYRRGDEQVQVLVDFDFTLDAGEFVVVTGPSGAGKSTLLHIAGGSGRAGQPALWRWTARTCGR